MKKLTRTAKKVVKKVLRHLPKFYTKEEKEALKIEKRQRQELEEVREAFADKDKEHVWAFIAGQFSQDFRGNPKYLFVYINKYRPDIETYWLTSTEETIEQVRSLGFRALNLEEPAAHYAMTHTGVLVVEQVKLYIPVGFRDIKYLNLWHGVGFKHIERKLFLGDIAMELSQKYIKYNSFYRNNQLMTVTSPMIEREFKVDCGLEEEQLIRSGYLRCMYQQNFEPVVTFDHDLRKIKGLSPDARMVVYAPTYRAKLGGTFAKAITDIEKLYKCCEENNILFIFKVHPNMEKEIGFLTAWETYGNRKHFWFWDNQDDFYEIMDQMDMAIIDYSAIFSDFVAVGIKHFVRYIFDYEEYMQDGFTQNEFFERTTGQVARNFDELLQAIETYDEEEQSENLEQLNDLFWEYAEGKADFEKTIQKTMEYEIKKRTFPILYSFDVFDTLFSRKVLDPVGIFYYVQGKMREKGGYPLALSNNYPSVRHSAEFNVREYYQKTQDTRETDHIEIQFEEIFARIAEVYNLSEEQVSELMSWELEAEYDNVIPLPEQIELVKKYKEEGNTVVLISDMYLSREVVTKMLEKADPYLTTLPLFLSSEYGVQKTTKKLFFEVYKSFEPMYDFEKWIHYGDNKLADEKNPRQMGIYTRLVHRPEFNDVQQQMVDKLQTYDAYLVAAMQTRLYQGAVHRKDEFVASYIALCMVPYVDWALRDSMRRGYETIYFISRDGHPLKRIADAIIETRNLPLKTKYIYASRRAWRTPSFISEVDEAFWQPYGNFADITSKEKLFRAMELDEEKFTELFPSVNPDTINFLDKKEFQDLLEIFAASEPYNQYLLELAKEQRVLSGGYLKQEIDADEKIAFIEYWGRGYTQDCMVRLWQHIIGEEVDVPYYYSRSIEPTKGGAVRHNFITNDTRQLFIESFFANMPYKSVESYEMKNGRIEPIITPISYDKNLFDSMERILPEFARQYAALDLQDPENTDRLLYEFALDYYGENLTNEFFAENIGSLVDSVALYGKKREYAPPYTMEDLDLLQEKELFRGSSVLTTSISMSVTRSDREVRERYDRMYQIFPEDDVAGNWLLTEESQEENEKFRAKYSDISEQSRLFRNLYDELIEKVEVEPNLIVVANNSTKVSDDTTLGKLKKRLSSESGVKLEILCAGQSDVSLQEKAELAARARLIVVGEAVGLFCKTKFREGTEEIMLCLSPFKLYNVGLQTNYRLKWKQKYTETVSINDVSVMQIPSPSAEETYRKSYCPNSEVKTDLLGCINTDIYFDETYRTRAVKKLNEVFPESRGKKVILYIPSVRRRQDCELWLDLFEMDILRRLLSDDYRVAVYLNHNQLEGKASRNRFTLPGFSRRLSGEISLRDCMVASDIVVGDYRDIFYQSVFFHKPVFSTAFDYEKQLMKSPNLNGMYNSFENNQFCPIVETEKELADYVKNLENYDYSKHDEIRERLFAGCDGHSLDRTVDYMLKKINRKNE
ncbi:MAG: CDP-glycerol glycerophosphotransferase family protein [Lachnospiraceae bacterium]|nr:CDP-glycerol glycerophosphotransferase family protein [Lachnospiraceae bacterium]